MAKHFFLWVAIAIVGSMFALILAAQVAFAGHLGLPQCYAGYCNSASGSFQTVGASYTGDLTVTQQLPPGSDGLYCVSLGFGWWSQSTGSLFQVYPSDPSTCNDVTTNVSKTKSFPEVDGGDNLYEGAAQLYWWDASMDGGAGGFRDLGLVTNSLTGRIPLPAPTVSLVANPTTITAGESVTFNLTVSGTATSCTAWSAPAGFGYVNGPLGVTGGSGIIYPTVSGTQFAQCSNAAGAGNTASVFITVNQPPPPAPSSGDFVPDIDAGTPGVQQRHGDTSTIMWNDVSGATSYNVYVVPSGGATSVCAAGCPLAQAAVCAGGTCAITGPNHAGYSAGNFTVYVTACNVSDCSGPSPTVNVTFQSNDAQFIQQKVNNQTNPATLTLAPGATFPVEIKFRNNGTATWDTASGYLLRSRAPDGNTTWGTAEVNFVSTSPLVSSVPPGAEVNFSGTLVAPPTDGTYNFQWGMYRSTNSYGYFGQASANVSITVGSLGPQPIKVRVRIKAIQDLRGLSP